MNRERWERLQDLYAGALARDGAARAEYLEAECAGDPDLLAEVMDLLQQSPPEGFVESPEVQAAGEVFGVGLDGRRLGDFVLQKEIGRGGMGVVYLATQVGLARPVALKLLPLARRDADSLARFEREANAASSLDHPSIVPILASGEADGIAWYAMRCIEGHDLGLELARQKKLREGEATEQPDLLLPRFESAEYVAFVGSMVKRLAEGLQSAHRSGVIHRDVKPPNILLDSEGLAYLTDFGLAKDQRFETLTATGDVRGTPSYMSPEQAAAAKIRVDHRTDVYSLCVVLYELLCLRVPHTGDTLREVITKITDHEAPPLRRINSRIPRDLALICSKGMSKAPDERYATAGDLADDLGRFLGHESILAKPPGLGRRAMRVARRHRIALGGVTIGLIALAAGSQIAESRNARRKRSILENRIASLMALDDWGGYTDELADLRQQVQELDDLKTTVSPGSTGQLATFRERLDRYRIDGLAEADRLLSRGIGGQEGQPGFGEFSSPAYPQDIAVAMQLLGRLSVIYADNEEVRQAADPERTFPRVSIDELSIEVDLASGSLDGAIATWHPIDPYHDSLGPATVLGTLPLASVAVPPGYGRIRVTVPGVGNCSITRNFARGGHYALKGKILDQTDGLDRMVFVEGGVLTLDDDRTIGCLLTDSDVQVAPFYLDEAEVSNGEFLEFLRSSGRAAPRQWRNAGFIDNPAQLPVDDVEAWFDLPAVNVSWYDARAYAEYVGKRLPTHTELEFAFDGADSPAASSPYPGKANVAGERSALFKNTEPRDGYRVYLRNALPCRADGYRQSPRGLFHAHGNVSELTESLFVEAVNNQLTSYTSTMLRYGSYWGSLADGNPLNTHGQADAGPEYRRIHTGFRCAVDDLKP